MPPRRFWALSGLEAEYSAANMRRTEPGSQNLRHTVAVVACFSVAAALGCSTSRNSGPTDAGADVSMGTGGTGSAGQSGTGGRSASGGQSGTGGQPGVGGVPGTGGQAGRDGGPPDATADTGPGTDGGGARDGGGDATAVDAGAPFAPCPTNGSACVILPLGDSITDGFPFEAGGYRVELFNQTLIGSKQVTFVGSLSNGPATVGGVVFPKNHEGHTGFTIINEPTAGRTGISPAITDTAISTYHPNIILLMIGTNDVDLSIDLTNAPARLATLVDEIIADAPDALLVVAQLTPTTTDAENVRFQAYNAAIPDIVQQRAAAGKHVIRVDMYAAFTANASYKTALMNDNLHPNATGYALMGLTWYAAIRSFLP